MLDIEEYNLIMQDVQHLKFILNSYANDLREPDRVSYLGGIGSSSESGDLMTHGDEFQMTSGFSAYSSKVI